MVKPLHDLVFIRPHKPGEYEGSIFIPEQARLKPLTGEVVAVGPGLLIKGKRAPMEAKVGDVAYWISEWMGAPARVAGEDLICIHDDELLAVEHD